MANKIRAYSGWRVQFCCGVLPEHVVPDLVFRLNIRFRSILETLSTAVSFVSLMYVSGLCVHDLLLCHAYWRLRLLSCRFHNVRNRCWCLLRYFVSSLKPSRMRVLVVAFLKISVFGEDPSGYFTDELSYFSVMLSIWDQFNTFMVGQHIPCESWYLTPDNAAYPVSFHWLWVVVRYDLQWRSNTTWVEP